MKQAEMKTNRTTLSIEAFTAPSLPEAVRINGKRRGTATKSAPRAEAAGIQPVTQVEARIDVGWGNTLFIRGEGAGLSWDKGTPLVCLDASTWVWLASGSGAPVRFKLLINDELWAGGDDQRVPPGARLVVEPAFPCWAR